MSAVSLSLSLSADCPPRTSSRGRQVRTGSTRCCVPVGTHRRCWPQSAPAAIAPALPVHVLSVAR